MNHLRTYSQLVRLPNVFTALADICLAAVAGGLDQVRWLALPALLAASACLYCAGMVWNDFFDLEQDRRERPLRPLPSGRVTRRGAALLAGGLMAAGLCFAVLAGWRGDGWHAGPVALAGALVLAILLYDGVLKRTWAGPLAMGTCRFLNVMLGLTAVSMAPALLGVHLALVVGVYVVGVTWFARTEARTSSQLALTWAAVVMAVGLLLGVMLPGWLDPGRSSPLFPYLMVGLGFLVGIPVCKAIAAPTPQRVQVAVKTSIMCLVVLDAVLATALIGVIGLLILVLLPPALYLGRWIYST